MSGRPSWPQDDKGAPRMGRFSVQREAHHGLRVLRAGLGVTCLFGPLLLVAVAMGCAPRYVESLAVAYTDLYDEHSRWTVYARFAAIETAVRVYDGLPPALLLAGSAAVSSVLAHFVLWRRLRPSVRRLGAEVGTFLVLAAAATLLVGAPRAILLTAVVTTIFTLNFPLPVLLPDENAPKSRSVERAGRVLIWVGALIGISHLLAPVGVLVLSARCFWPRSARIRRIAFRAGQVLACVASLPVAVVVIYASEPTALSAAVRPILDIPQLYDIVIDRAGNRLIVTDKTESTALLLSLDKLEPIGKLPFPTDELEDIEFDPESRQIYHADRATGNVFTMDVDTFRVRSVGVISDRSSAGSTKIALDKSSGRLLVSWEVNNLFLLDLATSQWTLLGRPANANPLADRRNGLFYTTSSLHRWILAIDPKSGKEERRAPGPLEPDRMVLSEKRKELYTPDARGGQIWVYSTPDLRLLRKIPSQFGVRGMAVDDDHGLLLAASVVTGYVEVIELETGEVLQRHYVGKYGRIMEADPATRRAFITLMRDGLFVLYY